MNKLKIVFNFLKIKLKNIGSVLLKGSTAYMIGAFGLIQVASIVADNINIAESLGVTKEIFMQYLFLGVIFLFYKKIKSKIFYGDIKDTFEDFIKTNPDLIISMFFDLDYVFMYIFSLLCWITVFQRIKIFTQKTFQRIC